MLLTLCFLPCLSAHAAKLRSPEEFEADLQHRNWTKITYRQNRGIVFDGDFPHTATKITRLQTACEDDRRVILGFNCFSEAVHECCLRAPEHSDAFNRTIKVYQAMSASGIPITEAFASQQVTPGSDSLPTPPLSSTLLNQSNETAATSSSKGRLTIEEVKKNPFLKKLILAAAKNSKAAATAAAAGGGGNAQREKGGEAANS